MLYPVAVVVSKFWCKLLCRLSSLPYVKICLLGFLSASTRSFTISVETVASRILIART